MSCRASRRLIVGSVGSKRALVETLTRATPLILTGVGTAVAYRARIWNIGAEGQLFAGAMVAYWATLQVSAPLALTDPARPRRRLRRRRALCRLRRLAQGALRRPGGDLDRPPQLHHPLRPLAPPSQRAVERPRFLLPAHAGASARRHGFRCSSSARISISASWSHSSPRWSSQVMIARTAFGFELRAFGYNPQRPGPEGHGQGPPAAHHHGDLRRSLRPRRRRRGLWRASPPARGHFAGLWLCRDHDRGAGAASIRSAWLSPRSCSAGSTTPRSRCR